LHGVVESDGCAARVDSPRARGAPGRNAFAARSGVDVSFDARDSRVRDFATAAPACVYAAVPAQRVERAVIRVGAGALVDDAAVPLHAASFERSQDVVGCPGRYARRIEVFHAHEPRSASRARFEIAPHRGDQ
jgi:hypothetical protein